MANINKMHVNGVVYDVEDVKARELAVSAQDAVAKMKEDLGGGTVGYITPAAYGAAGDGETDDTEAIQKALNTGSVVLLDKHYRVTDLTPIMGSQVIVNGTLDVYGRIHIKYPYISFRGNGRIKSWGDVCFELNGAGSTDTTYCKHFTIEKELTVSGSFNANTAFLITATDDGDLSRCNIVVYPEIHCKIQNCKYGIHSVFDGTNRSWFTGLRCTSVIENCIYAIVLDWGGGGSIIDAVIQPFSGTPGTDETPIVRVSNNCTIGGMIWDMHTAVNKYAIELTGTMNRVSVPIYDRYIYTKTQTGNIVENLKKMVFPVSSANFSVDKVASKIPAPAPYDNTNDFAKNAGSNKVSMTCSHSGYTGSIKRWLAGLANTQYIGATVGEMVLTFEFPAAITLREMFVCGSDMPDSVAFEYKNADGEWVSLKTCTKGIDYDDVSGGEAYAWWQFTYSAIIGFDVAFAYGVRITMNVSEICMLSRIYIGANEINVPMKTGDDLIATSFKLKGGDGKYYNVTVNGGQLVATVEE